MSSLRAYPNVNEDVGREFELVRRAAARDGDALRDIMQMNNQRLFRLARGIVHSDSEAEDTVQETYVLAFSNLGSFRGDSRLSTWLSRIVINEALGRRRDHRRMAELARSQTVTPHAQIIPFPVRQDGDDPERTLAQREILKLVEQALESLASPYRLVFVARVIEGLSMQETASLLNIRPETVKTRLHRARKLIRSRLQDSIGPVLFDAFPFAGMRCERLTRAVLRRIGVAAEGFGNLSKASSSNRHRHTDNA